MASWTLPAPPLDAVMAVLDRGRSSILRFVGRRARTLVVGREQRVAIVGAVLVSAALVATGAFPMWFLALGPIVWGVPHVVSDVRYLITRRGYHRRPWVLAPMLAGIIAAGAGCGVRGGLAGAAATLVLARASVGRRVAGVVVIAGLFALAVRVGPYADLFYAHAHNAVAVILWWAWRRRQTRLHWITLAIIVGGSLSIVGGALSPLAARTGGFVAPWTHLTALQLAYGLSPSPHGPMALRLLVLYAFGQSVHYVMWLRLIPEDDRPSPTPRSFVQSYRALRADVGSVVLWIAAVSAVAFAVWAAIDVGGARSGYLQIGFFHGYIEMAAAALLWAEATRETTNDSRIGSVETRASC